MSPPVLTWRGRGNKNGIQYTTCRSVVLLYKSPVVVFFILFSIYFFLMILNVLSSGLAHSEHKIIRETHNDSKTSLFCVLIVNLEL